MLSLSADGPLGAGLFPCPCCGYRVHRFEPGSHALCPICGWEDDLAQLRFVELVGSANPCSLVEAQSRFARCGAASARARESVRAPFDDESRDAGWRPVDLERDNPEWPQRGVGYADSYPEHDPCCLYYWRPGYWRRVVA